MKSICRLVSNLRRKDELVPCSKATLVLKLPPMVFVDLLANFASTVSKIMFEQAKNRSGEGQLSPTV